MGRLTKAKGLASTRPSEENTPHRYERSKTMSITKDGNQAQSHAGTSQSEFLMKAMKRNIPRCPNDHKAVYSHNLCYSCFQCALKKAGGFDAFVKQQPLPRGRQACTGAREMKQQYYCKWCDATFIREVKACPTCGTTCELSKARHGFGKRPPFGPKAGLCEHRTQKTYDLCRRKAKGLYELPALGGYAAASVALCDSHGARAEEDWCARKIDHDYRPDVEGGLSRFFAAIGRF